MTLEDGWTFSVDPDDEGIEEAWYRTDTEMADERDVSVPHVWQEHDALREYTGAAWYRRTVEVNHEADERVLLRFGAADYEVTVWVNGTEVGTHTGGYLPFSFDVTDALTGGDDTVAVRVFDPADLTEIPHGKQGEPWYTRVSGLWQAVDVGVVPETRVDDLRLTPDLDDDTVRADVSVTGPKGGIDLTARVEVTQAGSMVGTADVQIRDGAGSATVRLDDPTYWTPANPALCDVTVSLTDGSDTLDTYVDYFGMRSVTVSDGEWYLNGEPLRVRGALDQAYYPDTYYRPSDLDTYREEIETAKELGFNMLRKHIKPPHPRFVELADRLGILVWSETANPDRYTDASKRRVREQFEGMVNRDYNSPSVVVWSLYNEEWGIGIDQHDFPNRDNPVRLWHDEEKQRYLSEFVDDARAYDPSRLVCDNSGWAHVDTDVNDYHEYFVVPDRDKPWRRRLRDLVSTPEGNYATTAYDDPERPPTVISEFGTWGLPSLSSLRAHYDGDPDWFAHEFLSGLKRPAGVADRFDRSVLSDAYTDLDELAADWQRREFTSLAESIADMRQHEGVSGYVVTEFSDVEWEFNGVLDYLRDEKVFADEFAAVNGPTMVRLEPATRTVDGEGRFTADAVVVNDSDRRLETTLEWEGFGRSGSHSVSVDPNGVEHVSDVVDVDVPAVERVSTEAVTASLADTDARWSTDATVVPSTPWEESERVYTPVDSVASALADSPHTLTESLADSDCAVVTELDDAVRAFADEGGHVVVLPGPDGHLDASVAETLSIRRLPERESWNLCASFVYQTLFDALDRVPGWAFADLYPYAYVQSPADDADIGVGYTEGWVANSGAIVSARSWRDGTLTVCTLRLTDNLGDQPMSAAILARLLRATGDGGCPSLR
ncbi:glycoside hydrolase family 2 protein [Halopelagius fulvigenes]|uniref:Glycoside hydrolase family 2 protein n=1 Tax=Halopelagius fulvigenes TaxID=1198324 RepID=A0ABD5TSM9_9EURY